MLEAGTSMWAPLLAGLGLALLVLLVLACTWGGPSASDPPDESEPGSGGGGGNQPRRPRRPPPSGPDAWAEFERDFAAYVAAGAGGRPRPGRRAHDDAPERVQRRESAPPRA